MDKLKADRIDKLYDHMVQLEVNKMNRKVKTLLTILCSFIMVLAFVSCGSSDNENTDPAGSTDVTQEADAGQGNDPAKPTIPEDATTVQDDGVVKVEIPTDNFLGTWTADSGKAEHLYGSLEITLKEDGSWTGKVTGEKLYGTWIETDFGVHLYDEVELWECDLFYTDKCNFVLSENGMKVVLTKHE